MRHPRAWRAVAHASFVALTSGLSLASCGGNPAGPDPGGGGVPTPTGLAISAPRTTLRVNQAETFTATQTMSNGQTQAAQATWRSDNTAVLSIDDTGRARGLANGTATISATAQGLTDTKLIRVATDYQGTWTGDYTVRVCDASGDFRNAEFCDREEGFWPGDILPIQLAFTQDRDQVTGTILLGQVNGTARGAVDQHGAFEGTGSLSFDAGGMPIAVELPTLKLQGDGDRITGTFVQVVTVPGFSGRGYLESDLKTVVRTAAFSPARLNRLRFPTFQDAWRGFQEQ